MKRFKWELGRKKLEAIFKPSKESKPKLSWVPDILLTILEALKESSDACPPVKSAVSGALAIVSLVQVCYPAFAAACNWLQVCC